MLKDVIVTINGSLNSRMVTGIHIALCFNGSGEDTLIINVKDLSGKRNGEIIELDKPSRLSVIHEVYHAIRHPGEFWPLMEQRLNEKVKE
jgi:hypothetical protein